MFWREYFRKNITREPKSHFKMYLDTMLQLNASTNQIQNFIKLIELGNTVEYSLIHINVAKSP
ncbi:DUF3050 domain-containing protein [Bizionia gelidisalsuginis]|nr:DUF3050 domain-containing protein [Bizionia gelidisalsuginis]